MFNLSRLPVGENELPPDAQQLNMIIIEPVASKLSLYTFGADYHLVILIFVGGFKSTEVG